MARSSFTRLLKLIKRYQYLLWAGAFFFAACLVVALWIYYHFAGQDREAYWFKIADFLMNVGETIVGTVLIGGGLGGIFNFIFEEQKQEEEAVKDRLKSMQENREKRKHFRQDIKGRLQEVHDNVELARVLIKSHRSGRTYGEQIRSRIMPANIALQDLKRQLGELDGDTLVTHLPELQVSLTSKKAITKSEC